MTRILHLYEMPDAPKMQFDIASFEALLDLMPDDFKIKYENLKLLGERDDYHPEDNTAEHIKIVVERLLPSKDPNLIFAALFHDICKLDAVFKNEKENQLHAAILAAAKDKSGLDLIKQYIVKLRKGGLKSYGHADLAGSYVMQHAKLITKYGGHHITVWEIVHNHMRIKDYSNMRKSKQEELEMLGTFEYLKIFSKADSMLTEFNLDEFEFLNPKE